MHNRERFVHSLAVLDCQAMFDGGWMLPLGQEESIADLVSVYRELPGKRFETLPGEIQPVVVRTLVQDGQTFVYIVNDSPWPVTLKLRVNAPSWLSTRPAGGRGSHDAAGRATPTGHCGASACAPTTSSVAGSRLPTSNYRSQTWKWPNRLNSHYGEGSTI